MIDEKNIGSVQVEDSQIVFTDKDGTTVYRTGAMNDPNLTQRLYAGASGAELANIINEAALRAVRNGCTIVNKADLEESIEVVIAGYQKKNAVLSDHEKQVVSYHEIGHALAFSRIGSKF